MNARNRKNPKSPSVLPGACLLLFLPLACRDFPTRRSQPHDAGSPMGLPSSMAGPDLDASGPPAAGDAGVLPEAAVPDSSTPDSRPGDASVALDSSVLAGQQDASLPAEQELVAAFDRYWFAETDAQFLAGEAMDSATVTRYFRVERDRGLLLNDSTRDSPETAAPIFVIEQSVTSDRGATVMLHEDGSFTYAAPHRDFWGDDHFVYQASNGELDAVGTVRVTIDPGQPGAPYGVDARRLWDGNGNGVTIAGLPYDGGFVTGASSAGDVNGDGFDDVVVMASGRQWLGQTNAGAVYVVFGDNDRRNVLLSDLEQERGGGFAMLGADANSHVGTRAVGVGDVNGDGLDDLLVGLSPVGVERGLAYLVFGKTDSTRIELTTNTVPSPSQAVRFESELGDWFTPTSIEAGDINGDGLSDIVLGAHNATRNDKPSAGAVYVVWGAPDLSALRLIDLDAGGSERGFAILGAQPGDQVGIDVAAAGDVNQDGLDDLLLAAPQAQRDGAERGVVYVVYGKSDTTSVTLSHIESESDGGFAIIGALTEDGSVGERFGSSVVSLGDIDRDGWTDIAVQAADSAQAVRGTSPVIVVYGAATEQTRTRDASRHIVLPSGAVSGMGHLAAGDFNGDGRIDLIRGTPERPIGGGAQIVLDLDGLGSTSLDLLEGYHEHPLPRGLSVKGYASDKAWGRQVAMGDVNGDGLDDWIAAVPLAVLTVGRPSADQRTTAGHVVFGWDVRGRLDERDGALLGTSRDDELFHDGGPRTRIDGGNGIDTLVLSNRGLPWDLRSEAEGRIRSIEQIDLRGSGEHRLVIDDAHVRWLPSSRRDAPGDLAKTLRISGDREDQVILYADGYEEQGIEGRRILRKAGARYGLELDPDIEWQLRSAVPIDFGDFAAPASSRTFSLVPAPDPTLGWNEGECGERELLMDGNFDAPLETVWAERTTNIDAPVLIPIEDSWLEHGVTAHSGGVVLGLGHGDDSIDTVLQVVSIPPSTQELTFTCWTQVRSTDSAATLTDEFVAALVDPLDPDTDRYRVDLLRLSNQDASMNDWTEVTATHPAEDPDQRSLAGKTLWLQLRASNDSTPETVTTFYLDSCSLRARVCR